MIVVLLSLLVLVLIVVVGVVVVVVVVVVSCFVVMLLLGQQRPTENTTKKQQNPLFCSMFCFVVVITGLWPQKSQQPNAIQQKTFLTFFVRKGSVLQKEAFGFVLFTFFWCFLFFFVLLDFEVPL